MNEFSDVFQAIQRISVQLEFVLLAGSLLVAWGVSRWLGARIKTSHPDTHAVAGLDHASWQGLAFAVVALVLTFIAKGIFESHHPILVLRVAVIVLSVWTATRVIGCTLKALLPDDSAIIALERLVAWVMVVGVLLWSLGLWPSLLDELESMNLVLGKTKLSLRSLLEGILAVGAVLMSTLWISATIEQRILRGAVDDLSLRKIAGNSIRAILLVVGILFALSTVGVDLTVLSVLGGAVGVGLGLGLQKLASNYVSGFVILFERSLRIGDNVRVDTFEGRISDIKGRYTLIRSSDGREAIVPNEKLITERIENLSLADSNVLLNTTVTVGYENDPDDVIAMLTEAALSVSRVLKDPAPGVRLENFAPDGLEFTIVFWIADPENGQKNVRSQVNLAIWRILNKAGVEIPYPQRVVRQWVVPAAPSDSTATTDSTKPQLTPSLKDDDSHRVG